MRYDYPLAGEKIEAKKEILSNYQLQIIEDSFSSLGKNKKYISNLSNKEQKVYYETVKLYLNVEWQFKKNSWKIKI